ncbi:MAG: hypothetical protein OXU71_01495 [Gammaproteobacteria bacterium]|nr:hypothetical protein [Gammaproteobacteria bacterium]
MSDEVLITVITAAMFIAAVGIIVIAQYAPVQLWYPWRTKINSEALLDRSGQVGVITIAAGIGHVFLNDGGTGEAAMMSAIGVALIVISSVKTGGKS